MARTKASSLSNSDTTRHPNEHILAFEYPAVDLLPPGTELALPRPSNLEHRHKPDASTIHLDIGTEFFALLKPEQFVEPTPAISDPVRTLLDTVGCLKRLYGTTTLHIVSFKNPSIGDGTLTYRLWFESIESLAETTFKPPLDLNEEEWASLTNHLTQHSWLHLLLDLVHRSSERAFFDVRVRLLQTYSPNVVYSEETPYASLWGSQPPRTAPELLRARLEPLGYGGSEDVMTFRLPCTHTFPIPREALGTLDSETSLKTTCPTCSTPILQPEDTPELQARSNLDATTAFHASNTLWRNLDKLDFNTDPRPYVFETDTLISILSTVLSSFHTPTSITPAPLSPANLYAEELEAISSQLETSLLLQLPRRLIYTPHRLYGALYGLIMRTRLLSSSGPGRRIRNVAHVPGWEEFVRAWLGRAMNFLVERRCVQVGEGHEGLHGHDGGVLWYGAEPSKGGEEEMEDLIGRLGGCELE